MAWELVGGTDERVSVSVGRFGCKLKGEEREAQGDMVVPELFIVIVASWSLCLIPLLHYVSFYTAFYPVFGILFPVYI